VFIKEKEEKEEKIKEHEHGQDDKYEMSTSYSLSRQR
jgi:hypothetical protein